jgi:hypothetical protein
MANTAHNRKDFEAFVRKTVAANVGPVVIIGNGRVADDFEVAVQTIGARFEDIIGEVADDARDEGYRQGIDQCGRTHGQGD